MTSPIPGKQYTVRQDDNLTKIASTAYGEPLKWRDIYNANQTTLKSTDPNLIFPGEIIFIPELIDRKNDNDLENAFSSDADGVDRLIINDAEIPSQEFEITRTMDTAADGWKASIAWTPGADLILDAATKPYGYQKSAVYLSGKLLVNGYLYGVTPTLSNNQRGKALTGWSLTADVIDSTMRPPYEVSDQTLKQRAEGLVNPMGIKVIWDLDDDLKFDKMTATATDTIFSHLLKYAKQRGVLISSTPAGNLIFLKANVNGESVGTIEEGAKFALDYTANFDGRKRFNSYKAIGQSPKSNSKFEIAKDDNVPRSRMVTFNNPDSTEGDLKSAAEWRRSAQLAAALTIPFNSSSWNSPNGELWAENTIVTVKSKTLSINDGFNFLIRQVTFAKKNSGRSAALSLVPPQVYSGEPIPDFMV